MSTTANVHIGDPLPRVDGPAKVTGKATFAAEFKLPKLAYASMVLSTIPSGRISSIESKAAERASGVIAVLTHKNALRLPAPERRLTVLQDDQVFYNRQPIALVVAESLEEAHYAASLIRPTYEQGQAKLDFEAGFPTSYTFTHAGEPGDQSWGDVDGGLRQAEITIDRIYTTPIEHHNPMEPHATIAHWDGDRVMIDDATQHISGVKEKVAKLFEIPAANVHVHCPFTGGGFGCKGQVWSHVILATIAAKQIQRPVKLVVERPQMFGPVGARPRTRQHLTIGALRSGKLTAIRQEVHSNTSMIEDYLESAAFPVRVMYNCANISTISRIVPMNLGTPTYMRAPGIATGTYAVEVAMDELAYALRMDPLELRLANYAEVDPHSKKPFTSKHLRRCYQEASERFGWSKRSHEPQSMRDGDLNVGWGMATETYPGKNLAAQAMVRFEVNGRVTVASGTQEIGTGNYTIMTEVAADLLKITPNRIDALLGDTSLPPAPISAGSMSTASVMPAVEAAAKQAKSKLVSLATQDPKSAVYGAVPQEVDFEDGILSMKNNPSGKKEPFTAVLARNGNQPVSFTAGTVPELQPGEEPCHSFGAVFAEVTVDDFGMVRVRRVVATYDTGRIMNRLTARSQFIGGIVWGISLALYEETYIDPKSGRVVNANLADLSRACESGRRCNRRVCVGYSRLQAGFGRRSRGW